MNLTHYLPIVWHDVRGLKLKFYIKKGPTQKYSMSVYEAVAEKQ